LRKRRGNKMLDSSTKIVETKELYTLLALLHYVRKELALVDEFAEYFVDMSIYQLSQRIPQPGADTRADAGSQSERK
jgi:hypothetical protein